MKIKTEHLESAFYDAWVAYDDDACQCPECKFYGWGNNREEAIENLHEVLSHTENKHSGIFLK